MMKVPKLIKTERQHAAALKRIEQLMDAKPNTPAGDELGLLAALAEMYERQNFPIAPPDPIEAIRFRMEQQGLIQQDLVPYLGSRSRVSEGGAKGGGVFDCANQSLPTPYIVPQSDSVPLG